MWFRNLQLFKLTESFAVELPVLEEMLQTNRFLPCKSIDASSQGFIAPGPLSQDAPLVYSANGIHLFCIAREDKIIPAPVVNQMLDAKINEIEQNQGRKVRKREKETLKEEIYHQLVIRAFSRITKTYGYIDAMNNYLVIDAGSHAKAEEFTVLLRKALGSLKIEVPKLQTITAILTQWLKTNEYPPEFTINDRCILIDVKEGGSIRCQRQNLFGEDIQTLIHEGRYVAELALSWDEQVSFNIKDDFSIKSIKFLESVQDQAKDAFTETNNERFDADAMIMTATFRLFIKALLDVFGA